MGVAGLSIRVFRAAELRRIRVAWPSHVLAMLFVFHFAIAPAHCEYGNEIIKYNTEA